MTYNWPEKQVIISLAGVIAERRALQSDVPGWRRHPTRERSICFHEAGHAVATHALGWHAYELNIDPPRGLTVETGASVLAYCALGEKTQRPTAYAIEERETDRRIAAKYCLVMAGDWKGAVRRVHLLRAAAKTLVERNGEYIADLAEALQWRRRLDQEQIAKILDQAQIAVILDRGF